MSSQRVNIPTTIKDEHYRYKMERMASKIEGKGNGIKTAVLNMANVARDLRVPPSYPAKYFGLVFGAVSNYDAAADRAIVNGAHDPTEMENALNAFINKFVLCPKCHYPETEMKVKGDNIDLNCKACGNTAHVSPAEKLCKHIIAHPPTTTQLTNVEKRINDTITQTKTQAVGATDEGDDEEWSADVSDAAVRLRRAQEGLSDRMLAMTLDSDDGKKKKKKSKKAAADEEEGGAAEGAGEEDQISPVEVLKSFMSLKPDATDAQLLKAIRKIQGDYELTDLDVVCLMYESFFDDDILDQVEKRAPLIRKFCKDEDSQKIILSYTEELVGKTHKSLLTKLPLILEKFYDCDILTEEVIIAWHGKTKSKFVKSSTTVKKIKEAAKPFIEWLQNADEEDEEDEE